MTTTTTTPITPRAQQADAQAARGWRPVLVGCGAVSALTLLVRGAFVVDREAIAIGLALAGATIALGLLRGRWGGMATAVLGGLLLNDLGWMGAAVCVHLTNHGSPGAVLAPTILVVAGGVGVVASVGSLLRRWERAASTLAAAGVLMAGLLVAATAVMSGDRVRVQPGDVTIRARDMAFSQETLTATEGEVSIAVSNDDLFWHTFTVDAVDLDLRVPTGGTRRATFRAAPGRYEFVCAIPGHEGAGMRGTLVVRPIAQTPQRD